MSTVCAIIPTYNRGEMLAECLESILCQTRVPNEIIVVNDGSSDNTPTILGQYSQKVTVINKANEGKSVAINTALNQTKADYIWIVDDDDYASPEGLACLESALDQNASAGFAFGRFERFADTINGREFFAPSFWARAEEPNWTIAFLEKMFTFQPAMLVRRSAYDAVGFFDKRFLRSQDYEMTLRILRHFDCVFVPKTIFYQREHTGMRGPAAERFSATESAKRWLTYDRLIFEEVYKNFPIERMRPTFVRGNSDEVVERAVLLQRAGILAKRGLWSLALADWNAASEISAAGPTEGELRLSEVLIDQELAWTELSINSKHRANIRKFRRSGQFAFDISVAFCRPIVWQARDMFRTKRYSEAIAHLMLLVRLLGIVGTLARVSQNLRANKN